jgi:hypothetical protein
MTLTMRGWLSGGVNATSFTERMAAATAACKATTTIPAASLTPREEFDKLDQLLLLLLGMNQPVPD